MEVTRVTTEEVKTRMDREERLVFLDARKAADWNESSLKLPGAIRIPVDHVEEYLDVIPTARAIITYCT